MLHHLIYLLFPLARNMVAHSGIWKLFNDLYNSHRILEQPISQIIGLFVHLFSVRPARNALIAAWGQSHHLIYIP
jgi:hypothetical protein